MPGEALNEDGRVLGQRRIERGSHSPVSVVIPCYRCGGTVRRAVASVLAQTAPPAEVIVVDDASPEDPFASLGALVSEAQDVAIHLVRRTVNGGAAAARNTGWELASQPFVAFLDADDSWYPRKLEVQLAYMLDHPDVSLSGHLWSTTTPSAHEGKACKAHNVSFRRLLRANAFFTSSVIVRRDMPYRFDETKRHGEDYLLWLRIVGHGGRAAHLTARLASRHKPPYGAGGLSGQLWKMEKGELDALLQVRREGLISLPAFVLLSLRSLLKHVRRAVIVLARGRGSTR